MAAKSRDPVIRYLHSVLGLEGLGPPDAELLARFVGSGDAEAFEKLVRRHGPVVIGVCRRILGEGADADDAFQATIIVFARKAAKIRKGDSVGSWLHGVAHFISRKLQTKLARQRRRETKTGANVEDMTMAADPVQQASLRELGAILDEEVQCLPAACRAALVACHFEGQSAETAARQLGVPTSTLKTRLERGRELLRQRLEHRGIGISAVALSIFLGEQCRIRASAYLVDTTVEAALSFAATGAASVSTQVAALATNALRTMALAKSATGFLAVALVGMIGVLGGATVIPQAAGPKSPKLNDGPAVVEVAAAREFPDQPGDPLPTGAVARLGTARWRHDRFVGFAAFRPDGKSVVTVGDDMTIRVWEYPSGKELRRIDLPPTAQRALTPDFNVTFFGAAAMTPDGKTVATSMRWPEIRLHDVATGNELPALRAATTVSALAFSANGQRLAALDGTGTVFIWDWATKRLAKTFMGLGETGIFPRTMGFSPDGKALVTYDYADLAGHERLRLWNAETGAEVNAVENGESLGQGGGSLSFSPDSKMFAFVYSKGIAIVDSTNGKEIRTIPLPFDMGASCLAFANDGKTIFGRMRSGNTISEWDIGAGTLLRNLGGGRDSELDRYWARQVHDSMALSLDGKTLVLAGGENCPLFVDIPSGKDIPITTGHENAIVSILFSLDGKRIATSDLGPRIWQWDAVQGKSLGAIDLPRKLDQVVISPDGTTTAAWTFAKDGATLSLLDLATGKEIGVPLLADRRESSPMVFSGDSKILAVHSTKEPKIELVEVSSGRLLHRLPTRTAASGRLFGSQEMFASPDGKTLASFLDQKTLALWDMNSGKQRGALSVSLQGGFANPNEERRASRSGEFNPNRLIRYGVFSPDSRCLALDFADGAIAIYELATGRSRHTYEENQPPPPKDGERNVSASRSSVYFVPQPRLVFSPDGQTFATLGLDQAVHLRDVASGRELAVFRGHTAPLLALAFARDGRSFASAGWDTTALVWDVSNLNRPVVPIQKLEPAEVAANWDLLAGNDAAKAFDAILAFAASPQEAVAAIEQRIKPVAPVEAKRIDRLVGDLDSAEFKVRDEANSELLRIGEPAVPAFDKSLAANPSLETRRRLEALRDLSDPISMILRGDRLRAYRAVEILERIGTPEARRVLTSFASGAAGVLLTRSAEAALKR